MKAKFTDWGFQHCKILLIIDFCPYILLITDFLAKILLIIDFRDPYVVLSASKKVLSMEIVLCHIKRTDFSTATPLNESSTIIN